MQKLFKKLVFPLSLLVLLSTQGMHVHIHHCKSTDTYTYGLFGSAECDHHAVADLNTCCSPISNQECSINQKKSSDCCTDNHFFVKTIDELTISNSQNKIFDHYVHQVLFTSSNLYYVNIEEDILKSSYNPDPPPKDGLQLIIFQQKLKIPLA